MALSVLGVLKKITGENSKLSGLLMLSSFCFTFLPSI